MLKQLYIGSTSACFELDNREPYYAPAEFSATLNGREVFRGRTNVFSVFDLLPGRDYTLAVGEETLAFTTAAETCALNVRDFGAMGDGVTDDTCAIQTAIHVLPEGGRLYFPAGTYVSRPLALKSHMTMELSENAVLLGCADRSRYPVLPADVKDMVTGESLNFGSFEGNALPMYQALITAEYAQDIAIVGRGTLDGNAQNTDFWTNFRNFEPARPRLAFFHRCRNVTVHGITGCNGPSWHFHPHYSRNVSFFDILVKAPANSPNTDALDPESCDGVQIIGCRFSVGDDCIAIKSGKMEMGLRFNTPADHHTIRNCLMEFGHGAVTLGSETAAGVKNLTVTQCYFRRTDRGLRIKTRRGRGKLCNITNIVFDHIFMEGVLTPFVVNMWYNCCDPDRYSQYNTTRECLPVDARIPHLGKFSFRNIRCVGAQVAACYIDGLPEMPIDEVAFTDVEIGFARDAKPGRAAMLNNGRDTCRMGLYLDNVRKASFERVTITNVDGEPVLTGNCEEVSVKDLKVN